MEQQYYSYFIYVNCTWRESGSNMGALPNQKYDTVLIAYHQYLLSLGVKIPNGTIKAFLKKADDREVEIWKNIQSVVPTAVLQKNTGYGISS